MIFEGYKITSPFGERLDPFTKQKTFHTGNDLVKKDKSKIKAFIEVKVIFSGEGKAGSGFGGYGNVVAVLDKNGALHCYCHLYQTSVKVNQQVAKDQEVGLQGSTGRSTGSHLHYEIRKTSKLSFGWRKGTTHVYDPTEYLKTYK